MDKEPGPSDRREWKILPHVMGAARPRNASFGLDVLPSVEVTPPLSWSRLSKRKRLQRRGAEPSSHNNRVAEKYVTTSRTPAVLKATLRRLEQRGANGAIDGRQKKKRERSLDALGPLDGSGTLIFTGRSNGRPKKGSTSAGKEGKTKLIRKKG